MDYMTNVKVEIAFQMTSDSLGNIYNLLWQIKQAFKKGRPGGIFLAFRVIKVGMRLPAIRL